MLKTTPNFALFDPLWKLGEGWARPLYQLLKLYLRSNLRNVFDGHPISSTATVTRRNRRKSASCNLRVHW